MTKFQVAYQEKDLVLTLVSFSQNNCQERAKATNGTF